MILELYQSISEYKPCRHALLTIRLIDLMVIGVTLTKREAVLISKSFLCRHDSSLSSLIIVESPLTVDTLRTSAECGKVFVHHFAPNIQVHKTPSHVCHGRV
jgi:hypothetical protein